VRSITGVIGWLVDFKESRDAHANQCERDASMHLNERSGAVIAVFATALFAAPVIEKPTNNFPIRDTAA